MNIIEFLFGFPVSGCNVVPSECYILVFCGCRWEFVPYSQMTGGQTLDFDCRTSLLTISGLDGNTVDLSCCCNGGVGGIVIPSYELVINIYDPEIPGYQYSSFANAFVYLATITPTNLKPWTVRFSGYHSEAITIPEFVTISGDGPSSSILGKAVHFEKDSVGPFSGNNIDNCTILDMQLTGGSLTPILNPAESIEQQVYTPDVYEFWFDMAPGSGDFDITINGFTFNFPYNATSTDIQTAIQVNPLLGYVTVTGNGSIPKHFIITLIGVPSGGISYSHVTIANGTNANMFHGYMSIGQIEHQTIDFLYTPSSGTRNIGYTSNAGNYYQNFIALTITATPFDVLSVVQDIFAQILVAEGIDYGITTVSINTTGGPLGFEIILGGFRGQSNHLFVITHSDVMYFGGSAQTANFENVRIMNFKGSQDGGIICKNSIIMGGDYSLLGHMSLLQCDIITIDTQILLTGQIKTYNCAVLGKNKISYNGGEFHNTSFANLSQAVFNSNKYLFYTCALVGPFDIPANVTIIAYNTDIQGTVTIQPLGTLNTCGCTAFDVNNLGGNRSNAGDVFDNTQTGFLISVNYQGAIDELSGQSHIQTGVGSPVGVILPTTIGDRYIDTAGPIVYTAYGFLNTERVS